MVTSAAQLWDRLEYHQVLDYGRDSLISSVKRVRARTMVHTSGAEWKDVNLDFYCPEPMVVPTHVSTKRVTAFPSQETILCSQLVHLSHSSSWSKDQGK